MDEEIGRLLSKGVIEYAEHSDGEFISTFFLRPKSNGSYRMILNLKLLNEHVQYIHFKMESLYSAIRLITPGCYMASIDLKDAYSTVNVADTFRKFLRFIWRGHLYHMPSQWFELCSTEVYKTSQTSIFLPTEKGVSVSCVSR